MKLSIAYLNDVHGYLEPHPEIFFNAEHDNIKTAGGYARIYSLINNIRKQNANTLVFDGGDTFHGTLPVVESKGEAILPILNKIGFTAMVGHWDFAYGADQLLNLQSRLNYPMLGINICKADKTLLLKPYIITEVADIKVAVIGICSNIIDKILPLKFVEELTVSDGMCELPKYIQEVKTKGADIVVLLSHNGFPQDVKMLSEIRGVDICLSAHTHNRLFEPVTVNGAFLVQCGCHGSFLGHLEVEVELKSIKNLAYTLIPVEESIVPDQEMDQVVKGIMKPYAALKNQVVGQTSVILHRYDTLKSSADQLLLSAIQFATRCEVCFSNGWRFGAPIPVGAITKWDLYNLVPMNPYVSMVDMTGSEIIEMLEENLEKTFSTNPLSQMGGYVKRCMGMSVFMRIENPKGHRIQDIYVGADHLINDKIYKIGFITAQGVPEKYERNRKRMDLKVIDAMIGYLENNSTFETKDEVFYLV